MMKRWLSMALVLTLLASLFPMGASAEGPVRKGLPVLTFVPASKTISAQAGGPVFSEKLLGEFRVDGSSNLSAADEEALSSGITSASLVYQEEADDLLVSVQLKGGKLYATLKSPTAADGKADVPIVFSEGLALPGYVSTSLSGQQIAMVSVYTAVSAVKLDATTHTFIGKVAPEVLTATVNASGKTAADVEYIWSISAPGIVQAEAVPDRPDQQKITPLAEGKATLTVIARNKTGTAIARCEVTVSKVESTGVTLSGFNENTTVGERVKLTATISGDAHTDTVKSWSSSNPDVATIDANGVLTAISEGTTIITVVTAHGRTQAPSVRVYPSTGKLSDPSYALFGDLDKPGASVEIATTTVDAKVYYTMTENGAAPAELTAANAAAIGTPYSGPIPLSENKTYRFKAIALKGFAASAQVSEQYTVDIAVASFTLDKTAVTVSGKAEVVLTAKVVPENANIKRIEWTPDTANAGVSMVEASRDGRTFKLKTTGALDVNAEATVTYGSASATRKAGCKISVSQVPETGVSASPTALSIPAGRTAVLRAVVAPSNATHEKVDFYFDQDSKVLTVAGSEDGVVKDEDAITIEARETGEGKSETITLVTKNGLRATCTVTVTAASSRVAAPAFDKVPGTVFAKPDEADRTVHLTSTTKDASFYYTLNGVLGSGSSIVIPENTTAVVVAWAAKDGLQRSDTVTATFASATAVTSVDLGDDIEITGKDTRTITATLNPETAVNRALTWKSNDPTVATVAQKAGPGNELKAVITALKPGTAIITATTADGSHADSAKVIVNKVEIGSVKIFEGATDVSGSTLTVNNGEVRQLAVVGFSDSNETKSFGAPIWTSSDNTVASVDKSGRMVVPVAANSDKTATITVSLDGKFNSVTVRPGAKPSKVADLQFDVAEGTYDSEIVVKATTATDGARIYYTLNGSEPTTSSALFPSAGVRLSRKVTLKVLAVKYSLEPARASAAYDFNIAVTDVLMEKTSLTLTRGKTALLKATAIPSNATDAGIVWSVDRADLAKIDSYGTLTTNAVGDVTVTATAGSKTATCAVKIVDVPATAITLAPSSSTLEIGETKQLTGLMKPIGLAGKTISWTSNDEFVASVSDDGLVTARKAGTATITATVDAVKATAKITVEAPLSTIPAEPKKEVTFSPVKAFTVTEGASLSQVLGKLKPGEGETIDQIRFYCSISFGDFDAPSMSAGATPPRFDVARDGTVTLNIANVGDASSAFSYEWELTAKSISGFTPSDALMNSGRTIEGNDLKVVKTPAAKKIVVSKAATTPSMTTYKKKPVYVVNRRDGKIAFSVPDYTVVGWKSSNSRLLSINSRGIATLRRSGSTAIKVSAKLKGGAVVSQLVAIQDIATIVRLQYKVGKKWINFGTSPVTLTMGKKLAVRVVSPKGTKIFAAQKWMSDNPAAATYKSGYITGLGEGDVAFRFALDNGYEAFARINVVSADGMTLKSLPSPEASSVEAVVGPDAVTETGTSTEPDSVAETDAAADETNPAPETDPCAEIDAPAATDASVDGAHSAAETDASAGAEASAETDPSAAPDATAEIVEAKVV